MDNKSITYPCDLPSQSVLYPTPIPDKGRIEIAPIRGQNEELIAGAGEGVNANLVLRKISESLIALPDSLPFQDMLVSDWVACMMHIAAASYSPYMLITPTCPNLECGERLEITLGMDSLERVTPNSFDEEYKEPFSVTLPLSKEVIEFKLLRLRDMDAIEEYSEQIKHQRNKSKQARMTLGDPTINYTLARAIFSINGDVNSDTMTRLKWVRQTVSGDLRRLKLAIEKKETGYDLHPELTCSHCHQRFTLEVPIHFFRAFSAHADSLA